MLHKIYQMCFTEAQRFLVWTCHDFCVCLFSEVVLVSFALNSYARIRARSGLQTCGVHGVCELHSLQTGPRGSWTEPACLQVSFMHLTFVFESVLNLFFSIGSAVSTRPVQFHFLVVLHLAPRNFTFPTAQLCEFYFLGSVT